jgi:EmrB/QacA subfamily drug resistance transporter
MACRQSRGLVLAVILAGYLLVLIDVSILMVALPRIHQDLGFSPTSLSWAQNAYTLTFGGLLLLGARAGDLLGRRRTFIAGIALFAAASLAVGLAQSSAWMIGARAVQGIGAAVLAPSTLALLSTSFPEGRQRTRAMAAYGALAGIGTSIGLILGGALTQALSWRVGFFLNVPVGLAAILAAPRMLEETKRRAGRFELSGALSSTLGISALVYGIVRSADAGWSDPVTVIALAVGLLLMGLFVAGQKRSLQPIMPLRLFSSRERAGAYAGRFLFNGALLSFFFFMTQYLQGVRGDTPLQAGLAFLPVTAAAFAAAAATPRLLRHTSNPLLSVVGCAAMLIGTAWISRASVNTGYLTGILMPMIIFGVGQGLGLSTLTTAGMAGVAPKDAGVAGGLVNVAHHTGGALGLGILVTVFAAAGAGAHGPQQILADRVSASLTGAAIFLAAALLVTLITQRRAPRTALDNKRLAATQNLAHPGAEVLTEARAAA